MADGQQDVPEKDRRRLETSLSLTKAVALLLLLGVSAPAKAEPASIAVFGDWGAFREKPDSGRPVRCFAIAEPARGTRGFGTGAFASIGSWPAKRLRGQVSLQLSHAIREGAPVTLSIGDVSFVLMARERNAWTGGRQQDARIVATMRSGSSMSVASIARDGKAFADVYRLRGAASAIDAAMLACPMR